jgi:hypothetical protein
VKPLVPAETVPAAATPGQWPVATVADIVRVLKAERQRLQISGEELDARCGLPERFSCKIENHHKSWGRGLGDLSFSTMMSALGLKMYIVRVSDERVEMRR